VVLLGAVSLESDVSFDPELVVGMVGSRMVILVDQEDREAKADRLLAADAFAAQAGNLTAWHARGQICLTHA
jgi:3,4-dihydroxy-2-butanone 4-phosphate synthase